ncbi:bifunctional UDP-N-acetylglucosamine diphosphorylase/glucosamine-1-phosphate N-acetyltransferase GlmU [Canibacter zhoujuaniae]|uniref:bifunctional UDP-N-acetylglucosamine diphosphorylase/glucosamine-1-phosphate N-acetyltransferase GlmU n=1 Tax=Canibacter zhoujuaniae TaxID=2708343 RepID=UPI0014223CD7|nr:bifunctional UDP-N-acetylglucosamine diphosphorylase/glucosamine-1-phosphate N-acetyltransferase GlmU [Canibacter zhoujuaniae]
MRDGRAVAVVILAAGQGTRMKSSLPKVLHPIGGRALIEHVLTTAEGLNPEYIVAVVRHEKERVAATISAFAPDVLIVEQDEIPGTGRAVESALGALPEHFQGDVVVLSGDVPLIDVATLENLLAGHSEAGAQMSILSAIFADPKGLGRIIRDESGDVIGIVEEKDASVLERQITEINGGIYVFDTAALAAALQTIDTNNAQGEKYLTDAAAKILASGGRVLAHATDDSWVIAGVNDRVQLAAAGTELNRRTIEQHQRNGVTFTDPAASYVDVTVQIAADAVIEPGSILRGNTVIESGAVVGPATTLADTFVGADALVLRSEVHGATIAANATVGPFSYIRPGTTLGVAGKIGAFVESKNTQIGDGAKVPHLSYVGDASIGAEANIGAGTIIANYDGVNKHRTNIGESARVGSKSVLVAPVTIGAGAYTAAGAVVRKEVAPGALAMSVAAQRNFEGWVAANRPDTTSAKAAAAANIPKDGER